MFNFIFGNKSTINEKTLEQNGVKLIPKGEINIQKNNCIELLFVFFKYEFNDNYQIFNKY